MGGIKGRLLFPAAFRLVKSRAHAWRHRIRIHDNPALGIAGRPADGLNQRGCGAQEALFVRIQDGDKAYLRQVQPFPEQVDSHQHIKLA
ncbi:hypothetical protein SDC9_153700 [bioreactor metagenome]|uniref:Uncharacterized protein n=1 Tax=bioreactor metagenome TaxID=1076179 RepID=A0A645F1E9_9ZZZZ